MSISKIQDKLLSQKGCGAALAIGICVIMAGFILNSFGRYGGLNNQPQDTSSRTVAVTVGDVPVSGEEIGSGITQMLSQQSMMGGRNAPPVSFSTASMVAPYVLQQAMGAAALQVVAEQNHVNLSDDALLKVAKAEIDRNQPPKKPGAKPDNTADQTLMRVKAALADPQQRPKLVSSIVPLALRDQLASSLAVTEDQAKRVNSSYTLKRIFIASRPGVSVKTKAEDAEKAIKGGMGFEAAMDKFSEDPAPAPGKKISDSKIEVGESQILTVPSYKTLEGKPVGFVSEPIADAGGTSIYKVVNFKENAPKDFAANVNKYKQQFSQELITPKIEAEQKAVLDSNDLKWNSSGYKAIYDLSKASQNPLGGDAAIQKVVDEAKAAIKTPGDKVPALYAWFSAETQLYNRPGADKGKLRPGRIELLKEVLNESEDYSLRMELVDLYIQEKDGANALQNLVQASEANSNYDLDGQNHFRDIGAKGESLVALKLVKPDDLKALNDAQNNWKKNKADEDKMKAETAAEKAQQDVKDAADKKRNEELIKKEKAEAAKGGPSSKAAPAGSSPSGRISAPRMGQ